MSDHMAALDEAIKCANLWHELFMTLLSWWRLGDNFWKYMIDLTNWIRQDEKAGGSEWLNPTTQNRRTLNERTAHVSFCFPSFGLSLMREEVTMVIEDTAYLELCNAFFFFFLWNTLTARKRRGWFHPPGYEETRERTDIYIHIFTYTQTDGTLGANLMYSRD